MNILDIIIIVAVAAAMFLIAAGAVKRKKNGKPAFPCSGNCEGCGMCGSCNMKDKAGQEEKDSKSC